MTRLTELCTCSHEYGLHSHSAKFCLAARCRCEKFQPKQMPFVVPPPRQTLELHQEPTDDKETEK